jgi:rSAM/selenodomain-associated transferase 2
MPKTSPRISVIIPVLNEEAQIGDLLADLSARGDLHEVIVIDGGSEDRTRDIVRAHGGVTLAMARRGRGKQMNEGAWLASGELLLFLHADTRLPAEAVSCIRDAVLDPAVIAGAFLVETRPDKASLWLRPFLRLADLRSRFTSLPYGDQALFVREESFWDAGGFPEIDLMEDLELSRRLRRLGKIRRLPSAVAVSGRRFVARPLYYAVAMNLLPLLYRLGVPPLLLARLYGDPR